MTTIAVRRFSPLIYCGPGSLDSLGIQADEEMPVVVAGHVFNPASQELISENISSDKERKHAAAFLSNIKHDEHLFGRSLVRRVLGHLLNTDPSKIQLLATELGKPYLPGSPFAFNIAHSNGWVACAFSRSTSVGIDIEETQNLDADSLSELSKYVFSSDEKAFFESHYPSERREFFFKAWRRKEALLKANGIGLLEDLTTVDVADTDGRFKEVLFFKSKQWRFQSLTSDQAPSIETAWEDLV